MKYYLLHNTVLHEFDTPEEREAATMRIAGSIMDGIIESADTRRVIKKLAKVGRASSNGSAFWWFSATLTLNRTEQMITGLTAKVDLLVGTVAAENNRFTDSELDAFRRSFALKTTASQFATIAEREPAGVSNPLENGTPDSRPAEGARAPFASVDPAPGNDITSIPLGGGFTLQSEQTEAGRIWKVTSAGTVLAQTKPGSRFLALNDGIVDGAWFNAATLTLDSLP